MKQYLILQSFTGSQNGIESESFEAGTTRLLSDSLVQALGGVASGYVREAEAAAKDIAKAPAALADAVKEAIAEASGDGKPAKAEDRETKVTGPDETKPAKPLGKMSKAELVAYALALGLELVPDSMTIKEMIAAIEAHASASA